MTPTKSLSADEVFRIVDFESIRLTIEIKNTTTQTAFPAQPAVRIIELQDRGAILEVPARSCSLGHNLVIMVRTATPGKEQYDFESTAKVEAHEELEDLVYDQITVAFLQFDEKLWLRFCETFSTRQQEIERFLAAARGY